MLMQYEVNEVPYMIRRAHELGLKVAFNPSPIPKSMEDLPLDCVDYFIVNEVEGAAIAGIQEANPDYKKVLEESLREISGSSNRTYSWRCRGSLQER